MSLPQSASTQCSGVKVRDEFKRDSNTTILPRSVDEDHELYKDAQREFVDLATQYGTLVLLSTFIATLMITFLDFANTMIDNKASIPFQLGMVLCSMASACHICLVLVAGRAATQAYQSSRLPRSQSRPNLEDYENRLETFSKCLTLCENVQAFGTTLFSSATLLMCWYIFHNHIFVYFLFAFVVVIGIWVYAGGFWQISWAGVVMKKALSQTRDHVAVEADVHPLAVADF